MKRFEQGRALFASRAIRAKIGGCESVIGQVLEVDDQASDPCGLLQV